MERILDWVRACPRWSVESGGIVLEQGQSGGRLLVLLSGEVEVLRDDVRVARTAEPGAVLVDEEGAAQPLPVFARDEVARLFEEG